jgi:hypothetical protein
MDAEKQKADSGADHQEKTLVFHAAESRVSSGSVETVRNRLTISRFSSRSSGTIFRTKVQVEHHEVAILLRGEADLPGPAEHPEREDSTAAVAAPEGKVQLLNGAEESRTD